MTTQADTTKFSDPVPAISSKQHQCCSLTKDMFKLSWQSSNLLRPIQHVLCSERSVLLFVRPGAPFGSRPLVPTAFPPDPMPLVPLVPLLPLASSAPAPARARGRLRGAASRPRSSGRTPRAAWVRGFRAEEANNSVGWRPSLLGWRP